MFYLFQLTVGLYRLKVSVSRENVVGEGFVNITVKPGKNSFLIDKGNRITAILQ